MNKCPACSLVNFKDADDCKRCGAPLAHGQHAPRPEDKARPGSRVLAAALAVVVVLSACGLYVYKQLREPYGLGAERAARLIKESEHFAKAYVIRFPERARLVARSSDRQISPGAVAYTLKDLGYVDWTTEVGSLKEPVPFSRARDYDNLFARPTEVTVSTYTLRVSPRPEAGDDIRPSDHAAEVVHSTVRTGTQRVQFSQVPGVGIFRNAADVYEGELSLVVGRPEFAEVTDVTFFDARNAQVSFKSRFVLTKVGRAYLGRMGGGAVEREETRVIMSHAILKREFESSPWTVASVNTSF